MNPHFVAGRRRRRRHHPVCPTSLFIRGQPILEELFVLRGLHVPSVRLESREGVEGGGMAGHLHANGALRPGGAATPSKGCGAGAFSGGTCSAAIHRAAQRSAAAGGTGTAGPQGQGRFFSTRARRKRAKGSSPSTTAPFPNPFPQRLKKKNKKNKATPGIATCSCQLPYQLPGEGPARTGCRRPA